MSARPLVIGALAVCLLLSSAGCGKDAPPADKTSASQRQAVGRAAAVKPEVEDPALATFCDQRWPASGPKSRDFGAGPNAKALGKPTPPGSWRWVNYWATWCKPCLQEMPMLGRWRDALVKEGRPVALELWSVDEDKTALDARVSKGMPGSVWHIDGSEPLSDYLASLGMARDSVLPIHMVVDANGKLRCVRVGSVRSAHWGTVRKLLR